jgi:ubiquinone/menaquinone biosynthesis C-methylase UbiE
LYNEKLDSDLKKELNDRYLKKDRLLDLGTGPSRQAIQLSKSV